MSEAKTPSPMIVRTRGSTPRPCRCPGGPYTTSPRRRNSVIASRTGARDWSMWLPPWVWSGTSPYPAPGPATRRGRPTRSLRPERRRAEERACRLRMGVPVQDGTLLDDVSPTTDRRGRTHPLLHARLLDVRRARRRPAGRPGGRAAARVPRARLPLARRRVAPARRGTPDPRSGPAWLLPRGAAAGSVRLSALAPGGRHGGAGGAVRRTRAPGRPRLGCRRGLGDSVPATRPGAHPDHRLGAASGSLRTIARDQ